MKNKKFLIDYEELMKEWDYEKNKIDPSILSYGNHNKVWWICPKGHSYSAIVSNRTKLNSGCPVCANKKVLKGYNDLAFNYPNISKEWDYEKNNPLTPENVVFSSQKKVGWICNNGHKWEATINHRTLRNQGCPYCSGRKAIQGQTDLTTLYPELMEEWDYEKNNILPENLKSGSHEIIWWICPKGHSYSSRLYEKTSGNGCPYCSNRKVLKGYNDLATTNPELLEEWNYEKNKKIDIYSLTYGSDTRVWWKCRLCSHEWEAKVNSRAVLGTGCPNCHKYLGTSFQEQTILFYLKKVFLNVLN